MASVKPSTEPSGWQQMLDRDNAYDAFFNHCSPATLNRVSRTSKDAHRAVKGYCTRAYDIDRHLKPFVENPVAFRRMQMHTGLVISGSNALQFMDRTFYKGSDLDVYITVEQSEYVGRWISDDLEDGVVGANMGYEFVPGAEQLGTFALALAHMKERGSEFSGRDVDKEVAYRMKGLSGVFAFKACGRGRDGDTLVIQLMVCEHSPFETISFFHSTVVMNAITFKAAYSFFPLATFENMTNRLCMTYPHRIPEHLALTKYQERGWKLEGLDENEDLDDQPLHYYKTRWVGDRYCWTLPLDTSDIEDLCQKVGDVDYESKLACDRFAINGWALTRFKSKVVPFLDSSRFKLSKFDRGCVCYIPGTCWDTFAQWGDWRPAMGRLGEDTLQGKLSFNLQLQKLKELCM